MTAEATPSLLTRLASADTLPRAALGEAIRHPEQVADGVLAALEAAAAGAVGSPREENLLFWGLHVLGAARDRRACAPLLRLLRQPDEELDRLLGDALGATVPRIVAGVFDGDAAALHALLADDGVDALVRLSLFGTLAFLTWDGRVDAAETRRFVLRFDEEGLAEAGSPAWQGWADVIALLGWRDLGPRAERAWRDGRITGEFESADDFRATLEGAVAAPADPARFAEANQGYLDDVVTALEWTERAPEAAPEPVAEPARNPLRGVGRNDPCPCGSGRKYKKCCLAA